jgi:phospholipid/cholesterol/gamma-HCH transport system ATP-binding protein
LLKHIIGLLQPDSGDIFVDEVCLTRMNAAELDHIRRKFGMLFQDAALFDSLDVFDNIAFPLREHTLDSEAQIAERVAQALQLVGLQGTEDRWPSELSGGMRKRVGLARALVLQPEIMLYDEPTTGLDPITAGQINELILRTQRSLEMTALVISHDLSSTKQVADKIVMLHGGRIISEGTPETFFRTKNPAVRQFLEGTPQGPMTTDQQEGEHAT